MIYIILILAFCLRLISINQSLWLDEAVNVVASTQYLFWDFMIKYPLGDFHPPGYFAVLWIWVHVFGTSELVVRLPSVILGVGTVYLIFLMGKKIWNSNIGLLAALILAVSPLHIYYSQEARMYSLATFAVSLSFYCFLKLLDTPKSIRNLFFYALSLTLVLYSDYVAYLILPVQLIFAFWQRKEVFGKIFFAQLLAFIIWSPWLLIFPSQLLNGRQLAIDVPGWKSVVGGTGIKDVGLVWVKILIGRISFDSKLLYAAVVGLVSVFYGVILFPLIKKRETNSLIIFGWFGLPIILALALSFFIPVLSYFRLLFIVPALTLLLAAGLSNFSKKWRETAIGLVLILNFFFSAIYLFNPKFQRDDWKELANFLDSRANLSSIVLLENNNLPSPFVYYHHKIEAQGALSKFPANSEEDVRDLGLLLKNKSKIYLVDYLVDISDPQRLVAKKLQQIGFHQTKIDNFNGVGFVYEYSR